MPPAQNEILSFGPFRLNPAERQLTRDGVNVVLRGRAYDLLMALLSRPNEVISKNDLLREVWQGLAVEEGSLRFHMANLRKALGDGSDGGRYIVNSSGRGYTFVAQVARARAEPARDRGAVLSARQSADAPADDRSRSRNRADSSAAGGDTLRDHRGRGRCRQDDARDRGRAPIDGEF